MAAATAERVSVILRSRCGVEAANIIRHWREAHGGVPPARIAEAG